MSVSFSDNKGQRFDLNLSEEETNAILNIIKDNVRETAGKVYEHLKL